MIPSHFWYENVTKFAEKLHYIYVYICITCNLHMTLLSLISLKIKYFHKLSQDVYRQYICIKSAARLTLIHFPIMTINHFVYPLFILSLLKIDLIIFLCSKTWMNDENQSFSCQHGVHEPFSWWLHTFKYL